MVNVIRPLFYQLGNREFLAGCVKCTIKIINEPSLTPKSTYTRHLETKLAVKLGALLLNVGFSKCLKRL